MKNQNEIKIKYDGKYPNLCSGHLEVWINGKYYDFGTHCMHSGGGVFYDYEEIEVTSGEWSVRFPKDFPEEYKNELLEKINEEVEWGCCGGCV